MTDFTTCAKQIVPVNSGCWIFYIKMFGIVRKVEAMEDILLAAT